MYRIHLKCSNVFDRNAFSHDSQAILDIYIHFWATEKNERKKLYIFYLAASQPAQADKDLVVSTFLEYC